MQMQIQSQDNDTRQAQPRRLTLKKETLRQLAANELRVVAGGIGPVTGIECLISVMLICYSSPSGDQWG